jgi:hypothetical protein
MLVASFQVLEKRLILEGLMCILGFGTEYKCLQ